MKREWLWLTGLSICLVLLIPWSVLHWQKDSDGREDAQIRVLMPNGEITKLKFEEYILGVVAAEMPAEFEVEALKAQAIAARTYAVKRLKQNSLPDSGYDVDTTVKTQAWLSDKQMKAKWGRLNYRRYKDKIEKAVGTTQGLVLMANEEYIDAVYHSSSGRKPTERSEDVWNSSRSYLQNVSSEEEIWQRYVKNYSLTYQELYQKLGTTSTPQPLTAGDFQILVKTSAGRAKTLRVLGKVYSATQLRTLLELNSTDLEWAVQGDRLIITAYGNGHGVGMSQWGANDMAKKNCKAEEILLHFYPGTKIAFLEA